MSEDKGRWNPLTQQFDRGTNVGHAIKISDLEKAALRDRRERIATAVLAGLMARQPLDYNGVYYNGTVADAVAYADALIAELDKSEEEKT